MPFIPVALGRDVEILLFHCVPLCSTCHKELKRQSEEYRPTFRQGDAGRTHEDSDVGRQAHVAIVATVVSNW